MSDTISEKKLVDNTQNQEYNTATDQEQSPELQFHHEMGAILHKLKNDPGSITTEDARRLSENAEATDERSARIISAVESLAVANLEVHKDNTDSVQVLRTNLLTIVQDLEAAVAQTPEEVTADILKGTQSVVSKMQRAVGQHTAPHPELEPQLQQEYARIEPKVEQGTVTKAEADHLHSLEARAHGHTEKGGLTAIAQSVAAKRERQLSLSSGSNNGQSRGNSSGLTPQEQSQRDKEANLHKAETAIQPKVEHGTVTQEDANFLHSREMRAHGHTEKGGLTATAQSLASAKCQPMPSDQGTTSCASLEEYTNRKECGKDVNSKMAEMAIDSKGHKRENSQTVVQAN